MSIYVGSTEITATDSIYSGSVPVKSVYSGSNLVWKQLVTPNDIFVGSDVGFWSDPRELNWAANVDGTGAVTEGGSVRRINDDGTKSGSSFISNTNSVWQAFNVAGSAPYWLWDGESFTTLKYISSAITGFTGNSCTIFHSIYITLANNISSAIEAGIDGVISLGNNGVNLTVNNSSVYTLSSPTDRWIHLALTIDSSGNLTVYENNTSRHTDTITPISFTSGVVGRFNGHERRRTGPLFFINRVLSSAELEFLYDYHRTDY